jgi:hypothetical protein
MTRRTLLRCVFFLLTGLPWLMMASAQTPDGKGPPRREPSERQKAAALHEYLYTTVEFRGFDDPDTKYGEAFDHLHRLYNISITVNEQAFKDEGIDDLLTTPLARELPKMKNVTLERVVRKVLERIPVATGTMWLARGGDVEITTVRAYRKEFYPERYPDGPFPPLVSADLDKRPLEEALKILATDADANIVLDTRAGEKGKTSVTARLANVPLDTAVLLLADMAELDSFQVDGVYYVTTKENAENLRKKQAKSRPAKAEEPMKPEPAPQKTP